MARKEKKYNYIYKITCLKNERYYIGMHSTENLDDGYLGGGKRIKNSIKRYGKENHSKEILEFAESRKQLAERERQIVNEELLEDPKCLNLCTGGTYYDRGWKPEDREKAGKKIKELSKDPEWLKNFSNAISNGLKGKKLDWFRGKKHSDESKRNIGEKNSISQKGNKNSQFGTRWITNGTENKKILSYENPPEGWFFGRK